MVKLAKTTDRISGKTGAGRPARYLRLADLDEARHGRGEFETAEDIARWEQLRARNLAQRAAVQEALGELGPRPAFDIVILLDSHLSQAAWEAASLPERRAILAITVDKVLIKSPKEARPIDERVRVILAGGEGGGHARVGEA